MQSAQVDSTTAGAQPTFDTGTAGIFFLLLMVDSFHFVFARALLPHVPPTLSASLVLLIAGLEVGVYALVTRQLVWRTAKAHLAFFLAIGFLIAVSTAINYASVAFIDAGTASMLGKMTALYSLLFGLLWLHERLTPRQIAGALLALAGVAVITFQPVDYLRVGSLMIVGSTFLYALHAAIVKRYGGDIDFVNFFFFRLLFTAGFLLTFAVAQGHFVWPGRTGWFLLLLAATVDVTISRALYYTALRRLPISLFSIILMLSPVIAIIWSFFLFDTFPSFQQLAGGAMVLLGVLLATWRWRRK